jgi:hypothetical protein
LEEGQKGIAGFFSAAAKGSVPVKRPVKVEHDDDNDKDKDVEIVEPENEVPPVKTKKRKICDNSIDAPPSPSSSPPPPKEKKKRRTPTLPTFTCSRCSRTLEIPASSLPAIAGADYSKESIEEALKKVEDEERDYHLARDMVEEERKLAGWRTTSNTSKGQSDSQAKGKGKKKKGTASSSSSSSTSTKEKKEKKEDGQRSLGSFFKK